MIIINWFWKSDRNIRFFLNPHIAKLHRILSIIFTFFQYHIMRMLLYFWSIKSTFFNPDMMYVNDKKKIYGFFFVCFDWIKWSIWIHIFFLSRHTDIDHFFSSIFWIWTSSICHLMWQYRLSMWNFFFENEWRGIIRSWIQNWLDQWNGFFLNYNVCH